MRSRRGFTLIELLVVIAIIAILAAILFPVFLSAKKTAQKGACVSNLKQIDYAYRMYLADYNDYYPSNDFGANLFLVEPYLRSRRFKMSDTGGGLDTSVWLCPSAQGKLGLWYRVTSAYWGSAQNAPWWKMGIHESTCRVWNSYVVNDDVTTNNPGKRPANTSKVRYSSRTVFFAEACYNPNRRNSSLDLGTAPTALHPSDRDGEVTSGFYPGYPSTSNSNVQAWHGNGANFLFCDSHIRFLTQLPPEDQWIVPEAK